MKRTTRTLINLGKKWGHVLPFGDLGRIKNINVLGDGRVRFSVLGSNGFYAVSLRSFKNPNAAVLRLMKWNEKAIKELGITS